MNVQSIIPFLLIIAPFALAFLLEALVIYFFKVKRFWGSLGLSILINLFTIGVLYGASLLLTQLGYTMSGFRFPVQVVLTLWWVSVVVDGLLLQVFSQKARSRTVYLSSIVMNTVSYLFLYLFLSNSH